MRDAECIEFLQWVLPRMEFHWPGFRKVRGQVCKRIGRRLRQIDVADLSSYRQYLLDHPEEWPVLDNCCRITISRFARDRRVYDTLISEVLPRLARQVGESERARIDIWSAGCGAGEEPYSVAVLASESDDPDLTATPLRILATDAEPDQLRRAAQAVYTASSLRELSEPVRRRAFAALEDGSFQLDEVFRQAVEFRQQDLRREMPEGPFHLVLCRNLAFTYFDLEVQQTILDRLLDRLVPAGYLVIGTHEQLPSDPSRLAPHPHCPCVLGPPAGDPLS